MSLGDEVIHWIDDMEHYLILIYHGWYLFWIVKLQWYNHFIFFIQRYIPGKVQFWYIVVLIKLVPIILRLDVYVANWRVNVSQVNIIGFHGSTENNSHVTKLINISYHGFYLWIFSLNFFLLHLFFNYGLLINFKNYLIIFGS